MTDSPNADEGEAAMQTGTKERAAYSTKPGTTTRLTCHAPHPVITVHGARVVCGSFVGYGSGEYLFVATATHAPEHPDGDLWVRCSNPRCRMWNRFRRIEEAAA